MQEFLEKADLVVVGGGLAGLITALKAAEAKHRVVVLEKGSDQSYLCNSRLTSGVFHCCRKDVRSPGAELSAAVADALDPKASDALAEAVAANAYAAVKWLQQRGIRFVRGNPAYSYQTFVLAPPNIAQMGRAWQGRGGDVLLRSLEQQLLKNGGKLLRGHEVTELLAQGKVHGVKGVLQDGQVFAFEAAAVVLADGGFQADPEALRAVTPSPERMVQRNARTGLGSALRMARAVGAEITDLQSFYGHVQSRKALENDQLWPYPWLDEILKHFIVVGKDGRRFTDEGQGGITVANHIARRQDPADVAVILDQAGWETAGRNGMLPPNPSLEQIEGAIIKASTIDELAQKVGIDSAGLQEEVAAYNAAIAGSSLHALAPARSDPGAARPIASAPFYALPAAPGITYTMGGPLVDENGRVMSTSGEPIEGLYAVGSAGGGIEGSANVGYVGGLIKAAVTGLCAAEHFNRHR